MTDEIEDDVFNDAQPEAAEQEAEQPETEEVEEGVTETAEDEPETEETEEAEEVAEPPAAETEPSDIAGLKAALKAERSKRQALEAKPKQAESNIPPEIQMEIAKVRRETSANIMRTVHTDYDDTAKIFLEMAKANPALAEECNASENPALFAYQKGKEQLEIQEAKKFKDSEEFKEFQAWKKSKPLDTNAKRKNAALSLPSLNKAASTPPRDDGSNDDVFADSAF